MNNKNLINKKFLYEAFINGFTMSDEIFNYCTIFDEYAELNRNDIDFEDFIRNHKTLNKDLNIF